MLVTVVLMYCLLLYWCTVDRIDGVMVSVLGSSVVDRGFEPRSGQTNDYTIGICCFSIFLMHHI